MTQPQGTSPRFVGKPWIIPATLAAIALLLRLVFYSQLRATPFFGNFYSDSRLYVDIARSIVAGDTLIQAVFMSPLYPLFLAAVEWVLGDIAVWGRMMQIGFGTGTVVLTYVSAARMFNRTTGYCAGLLAALYPAFIFYDSQILLESILTFTIIFHLYALLRSFEKNGMLWPLVAGLAMGASIALRGSTALFLPMFVVYLWRRKDFSGSKLRFAGLYLAGALLAVTPLSMRNSSLAGEFVPLTTSFGLNLYAGNNSETDGRYDVPERFDGYREPSGRSVAEKAAERALSPMEVNAFWTGKATYWMMQNPTAYLALNARKMLLFFHFSEIQQAGLSMSFVRKQYDTVLDLPMPPFVLVFMLALAGIVLAWGRRDRHGFVLLYAAAYLTATTLFFVNDRLRTPMVVIMALWAGYALAEALTAAKQRSFGKVGVAYGAAIAIAVLVWMAQPSMPQAWDAEYNRLGDVAFAESNYRAAESYFAQSIQQQPTAINLTNLGNALASQEKFAEAERSYEDAIRLDATYPNAFFNKGHMAHQRGKPEVAFRYWNKTVQLDPEFAPAYRNMGLLLFQYGKLHEARSMLVRYLEVERDASKQQEIRRDIANIDDMLRRTPETTE